MRRVECELYEPGVWNLAAMAFGRVGDRKVWAQTLLMEKGGIEREGCWVGLCFYPLPAFQREGNWRRFRMSDVYLRGKCLCVGIGCGTEMDVCTQESAEWRNMFCMHGSGFACCIMFYDSFLLIGAFTITN